MDFKNKVVIVTGGSSGIGAAIALGFAKLSAKVVVVGRNADNLQIVAQQCENSKGMKPLVVQADLTVDSDVASIVEKTIKHFGQIDVLVNNAGVGAVASILDGVQIFDKIISTNLRSIYLLCSLAVPYLMKTKGNIVNISSVAATKVIPKFLPYAVSKAGLDMFTKSLAGELGVHGIRVNAVSPGPVDTNFFERAGMDSKVIIPAKAKQNALRKNATSEDVVEMVIFYASDKASSTTGNISVIDGGNLVGFY